MQIQPICNHINRPIFKGTFEQSEDLNKLMNVAPDKDLMEFSLLLDTINSSTDKRVFYVKEKRTSIINPDKGYILWCQEHWDSFPKPFKSVIVNDIDDTTSISPILSKFTDLLKSIYNVNFDKDIKSHFKKQIIAKLTK